MARRRKAGILNWKRKGQEREPKRCCTRKKEAETSPFRNCDK